MTIGNPPRKSSRFTQWLIIAIVLPFILGNAGCPNALTEFANKTSDEALLYKAKQLIQQRDHAGALQSIALMSTTFQATRDGKVTKATALAGRCGLDLLELAEEISTNLGSKTLFAILLSYMKDATTLQDCYEAEQLLYNLSESEKTIDDYVFLSFIELAKIGAGLARMGAGSEPGADSDNDGNVDTGGAPRTFNPCLDADLADSDVQQIATGLTISIWALQQSGSSVLGGVASGFQAACTAVATVTGSSGFCDQRAVSDFDANEIAAIRTLINANEVGLNTCGGSTTSGPPCTCIP